MKLVNPFSHDFWVDDDPACVKYEHTAAASNVVHLNTNHARANAAQAAMLLESDRAGMRTDLKTDLLRQRREYEALIARIDDALMELAGA